MRNFISIFTLVILAACGPGPANKVSADVHPGSVTTASWVSKLEVLPGITVMETTPFVFNGAMYLVAWDHAKVGPLDKDLVIYTFPDMTEVSRINSGLGFISAIVDNGMLRVYGTVMNGPYGYEVRTLSTSDLLNWSNQTSVYTVKPNETVFNTTVTKDGPNSYVMALEYQNGTFLGFHIRFLRSTDMVTWTELSGDFSGPGNPGWDSSCPALRYINGYYYMFYASEFEGGPRPVYATLIDRSKDLVNWEESSQGVLWPDYPDQNRNNSDMDLVEFNGKVEMVYSKGYQEDASNVDGVGVRHAESNMALQQFVEKFFQ